jgi:hypothetical protein
MSVSAYISCYVSLIIHDGKMENFYIHHLKEALLQNAASVSSVLEHIFHVITQLHVFISWYQNTLHKTQ